MDDVILRLLLHDGSRGQNPNVDDFEKPIYVLMALSGLVLLLACANLAKTCCWHGQARGRGKQAPGSRWAQAADAFCAR